MAAAAVALTTTLPAGQAEAAPAPLGVNQERSRSLERSGHPALARPAVRAEMAPVSMAVPAVDRDWLGLTQPAPTPASARRQAARSTAISFVTKTGTGDIRGAEVN